MPESTAQPAAPYQIHHYPATLIDRRMLGSTQALTLRPVLPQDDRLLAELVAGLSPNARRNRFHGAIKLSAERFAQMSRVDYRSQLALVVTTLVGGVERVIADARYVAQADAAEEGAAEFALMVDERWQRRGVARWALQALQGAAKQYGLQRLHGGVLAGNTPMLALMQHCGFETAPHPEEDGLLQAQRRLDGVPHATPAARRGGLAGLMPTFMRRSQVAAA